MYVDSGAIRKAPSPSHSSRSYFSSSTLIHILMDALSFSLYPPYFPLPHSQIISRMLSPSHSPTHILTPSSPTHTLIRNLELSQTPLQTALTRNKGDSIVMLQYEQHFKIHNTELSTRRSITRLPHPEIVHWNPELQSAGRLNSKAEIETSY